MWRKSQWCKHCRSTWIKEIIKCDICRKYGVDCLHNIDSYVEMCPTCINKGLKENQYIVKCAVCKKETIQNAKYDSCFCESCG